MRSRARAWASRKHVRAGVPGCLLRLRLGGAAKRKRNRAATEWVAAGRVWVAAAAAAAAAAWKPGKGCEGKNTKYNAIRRGRWAEREAGGA